MTLRIFRRIVHGGGGLLKASNLKRPIRVAVFSERGKITLDFSVLTPEVHQGISTPIYHYMQVAQA